MDNRVHVVGEHKCENLVGYIVRQLFALVPNLAIYSFVFALDVRELVSMRATITAQRGKAIVQSSSFTVEPSHHVTVNELDEMWRRQLFAVVSDHHSSHIFPHPSVEGQHAINVVVCLYLIDFDRKGQFVIGVTGLSPGRLELKSREITVGQ